MFPEIFGKLKRRVRWHSHCEVQLCAEELQVISSSDRFLPPCGHSNLRGEQIRLHNEAAVESRLAALRDRPCGLHRLFGNFQLLACQQNVVVGTDNAKDDLLIGAIKFGGLPPRSSALPVSPHANWQMNQTNSRFHQSAL